jgi:hypothetical protein
MKISVTILAIVASAAATAEAFQAGRLNSSNKRVSVISGDSRSSNISSTQLHIQTFSIPIQDTDFDKLVKTNFPGAIDNKELVARVVGLLELRGFTPSNTLLATSVCADELARQLEDDFIDVYGTNFNLGGLSGFPFAGNTGWGAMSAHVPDNGYCLTIHGPHVGITKDGIIGKVERSGIALVDSCCGSAIAASNYLRGITDGSANINPRIQSFSDFQQGAVQELILPFGMRLARAENRMRELPYALYDSQEVMVNDIVNTGKSSIKKGLAVLGGIQINTAPDTSDYFHPLRFDYFDENGDLVENMLPYLK